MSREKVNSRTSTASTLGQTTLSERLNCITDELQSLPGPSPQAQDAMELLKQELAQLRSPLTSRERRELQQAHGHGDDLTLRLSHLRSRVDWLAQEMARLGEQGVKESVTLG